MRYFQALFSFIWLLFANPQKQKEEKAFKPLLPLNLQLFAGDPPPADPPPADPPPGDDKKFTQDELDKIVTGRLAKAEKAAQKNLAKQLGYDSVEAMTEALKKSKPGDNNPPNVDEIVDTKLKEQLKAEQEKTFKRLVNAEVKVVANELGFADWEDALALADMSQVKEDEKGNIVGVKEALEALKTKKPHLLKAAPSGRFGASIPNDQQRKKENLEAIKNAAKNRGTQQTTAHNPWA
jgi:thymidine phosphorylase